jgi:hypothetical protein
MIDDEGFRSINDIIPILADEHEEAEASEAYDVLMELWAFAPNESKPFKKNVRLFDNKARGLFNLLPNYPPNVMGMKFIAKLGIDHKYIMSATRGDYDYKVVRDAAKALYVLPKVSQRR